MKTLKVLVLLCTLVSVSAGASITAAYTLDLSAGTLNGNALTSVMILESGSGMVNLDFPYVVPGSGVSVLSHEVAFVPTMSLIVGLDLPSTTGGDNKTHVIFFTNSIFANDALGRKFSEVFPNTHHDDFISRMLLAEGGDATQIAWLTDFFLSGDGVNAAFVTSTQPVGIEYTYAVFTATPEPQTLVLAGMGLLAMVAVRRRLGSRD